MELPGNAAPRYGVPTMRRTPLAVLSLAAATLFLQGQQAKPTMSFEEYDPKSTLVTPQHPTPRSRTGT